MRIGKSIVDFKGLVIAGPEGRHKIEPMVMRLLNVLVENVGEVKTRSELITEVWGVQYGGDESLSRGISILRKALGDKRGEHTHIETIPRVGYRFIAKVALEVDNQSEPVRHDVVLESLVNNVQDEGQKLFPTKKIVALLGFLFFTASYVLLTQYSSGHSDKTSLQKQLEHGFSNVENYTPIGAIDAAKDLFGQILDRNPNHAAARAGLAFALFRQYTHLEKDPAVLQRARGHAEASLRQDEHLALANIAVAWAAESEGNFERAHKLLDRADILDVDNILAMEGRYRLLKKAERFQKADEMIERAISTYPDKALFYTYRGRIFERNGDLVSAERDFRKAISLSPDGPRIYAQLAQSLHLQGHTQEAISVIQQGLAVNETPLLYNNLGTYLFFSGQYDLAATAFEKTVALKGDTHDYIYWANLGDAYRWSRDKKDDAALNYKRALQLLQADLDRYPNDSNSKSRAALFNAKLGNFDQTQHYMNSFELTPESPVIQVYRAVVIYEILSDRTKALEYLDVAIAANYPMTEILNDPELALLRQDPAYHRLLAKNSK